MLMTDLRLIPKHSASILCVMRVLFRNARNCFAAGLEVISPPRIVIVVFAFVPHGSLILD
jgi:hypothetical protein